MGPCFSIASRAYWEHVGWKRQAPGRTGDTTSWYPLIRKTRPRVTQWAGPGTGASSSVIVGGRILDHSRRRHEPSHLTLDIAERCLGKRAAGHEHEVRVSSLVRPGSAQSSVALAQQTASAIAFDRVPHLAAGHEANLTVELRPLDDEQDHELAAMGSPLLVDPPKRFPAPKSLPLGETFFPLRHPEAASRFVVGGWHPAARGPRRQRRG